jgi:hypothetical protein
MTWWCYNSCHTAEQVSSKGFCILFVLYSTTLSVAQTIQSEHKRNLHFQNDNNTNEAFIEIQTHTSRHRDSQCFVSNNLDCCCSASHPDDTRFANGYPTTEELVYSELSNKEFVTAVKRAFRTQFHMEPRSRLKINLSKFSSSWVVSIKQNMNFNIPPASMFVFIFTEWCH